MTVNVPCYEARCVEIIFRKDSPKIPRVRADGPVESKHRFPTGELCMWFSGDSAKNQWIFEDGLVTLIGHVAAHLFREAWWRETGEWLGLEVEHSNISSTSAEQKGV